jgi:hypothetical protein
MADYDSDSSYEGEDYTETNVLLGYAAQEGTGDATGTSRQLHIEESLGLTGLL